MTKGRATQQMFEKRENDQIFIFVSQIFIYLCILYINMLVLPVHMFYFHIEKDSLYKLPQMIEI